MKPIEIFRSGDHRAMSGADLSFSESDLAASVSAYDPTLHEAPLVAGHPRHDAPAYGWVKELSTDGKSITATPHQVNPEFSEMVEAGSLKKVSACFYAPGAAGNPAPGTYYLRHVGFLGAQPPAIKGLKQIEFAEEEDGLVTFEFAEFAEISDFSIGWVLRSIANLFQGIRDKTIEAEGLDAADTLVASHNIQDIRDVAAKADAAGEAASKAAPSFSETPETNEADMDPIDQKKLDTRAAELKVEAEKLKADRAAFAEEQAQARVAEDRRFVDQLANQGKVAPGAVDNMVAFMSSLDAGDMIAFGEADADQKSAHAFFKELLEKSGEVVNFGEASPDDGETHDAQDANAIAAEAIAFQESEKAAGRTIDMATAVAKVSAKK